MSRSADRGASDQGASLYRSKILAMSRFVGDTPRESLLLLTLGMVVATQPLLEVLGSQPPFFIARKSPWGELWGMAFALLLIAATPALVHLAVSRASSRSGHLAFAAGLLVLLPLSGLMVVAKFLSAWPAFAVVLAGCLWTARAYWRQPEVRDNVFVINRLLVAAGLAQIVYFLFASPAALAVRALGGAEARGLSPVKAGPPLVLIVLDELPLASLLSSDGEIDATTFPNFARLASTSTWFRNATGVADYTDLAAPPILTGQLPDAQKLGTLADYPNNLLTWLNGPYKVVALESLTTLAPPGTRVGLEGREASSLAADLALIWSHRLLPSDLRKLLPDVEHQWGSFQFATARDQAFKRFVDQIGPEQPPPFYFFHSPLPHYPYIYQPQGATYDNGGEVVAEGLVDTEGGRGVWSDRWTADQAYRRHLLQLVYVDTLLGSLLDRLESSGLWEDCLFLLTVDHGADFEPLVSHRNLDNANYMSLAAVPFFLKLPGQNQAKVDRRAARNVDIPATIAAQLGTTLPWRTDGHDLTSPTPVPAKPSFMRRLDKKIFDFEYNDAALEKVVAHKEALFGKNGGVEGLYRHGPRPDLLGRQAADLATGKPAGTSALEYPSLLADVRPDQPFQPNRIGAQLSGLPRVSAKYLPVAVAVQGVIACTTMVEVDAGRGDLFALVPEGVLRAGANQVTFYLISSGPEPTLHPLPAVDSSYSLAEEKGKLSLRFQGQTLPVTTEIEGELNELMVIGEEVHVRGWAGETQRDMPASAIVFFRGEQFLLAGTTGWERPDLSRFGPRMKSAAFTYSIPATLLSNPSQLRVFAVLEGQASELPRQLTPAASKHP